MSESDFAEAEERLRVTEAKVNAAKAGRIEKTEVQLLDESATVSAEVYRMIKPVVEMRRRQVIAEQELQADLNVLAGKLAEVTVGLARTNQRVDALVNLRSKNAEKESKLYDELLALL